MTLSTPRIALVILALWLAGLGAAAQFSKIAIPFALFQAQYPDAGWQLGWLLSIISFLGMLLGMTGGIFVARLGFVRPLMGALILGAVLSWRQASLPPLPEMLVLRLVEGASHLTIVIAAPTLIGMIAPTQWRGAAMTLWSSFFGVAFALTTVFGLPLAQAHGLGALLNAHALWMMGTALVLAIALKGVQAPTSTRRVTFRGLVHEHLRAYGSASITAPAWGWLPYTATFVAGLAILPSLLPDDSRVLIATAMPLLAIATSLVAVPVLLRAFSATRIAIAGFILAAAISLLGALGLSLPILCPLLFATLGLVQGGSFAAIPQLNSVAPDQALANGAMAQTGNLGNMLGTPVLLAILSWGGDRVLMASLGLLYLFGALAHVHLGRRRAQVAV
jgi:MFS family permease|tara:strand:- start:8919 stop:10091 length:1173 start_codon:yes stop_codon:yes gene_type:complete